MFYFLANFFEYSYYTNAQIKNIQRTMNLNIKLIKKKVLQKITSIPSTHHNEDNINEGNIRLDAI